MQDSEKLRKILAEARILENRIREAIPTFNSDLGVLKKLKQEISQFITSNQASGHFDYIENQTTTSDILLTAVIKQFTEVKKLIDPKPHNTHFFRPSPRYNLSQEEEKKLTSYLQAIREELNKFFNKNSDNEKLAIKSAAPSA